MDGIRFTLAEYESILNTSADDEASINTEFSALNDNTDEAMQPDGIVIMSMHEIDPIEDHFVPASDTYNVNTLTEQNDDTKVDDFNSDDSEVIQQQSDFDDVALDAIEIDSIDENSATQKYISSAEITIDIPDEEHSVDNFNSEHYHGIEYSTDEDEKNQTATPLAESSDVTYQATQAYDNDYNRSTSSTPSFDTTGMRNESDILMQMETTDISEDDRSLLDLFAESAKVYLTQEMVCHLFLRTFAVPTRMDPFFSLHIYVLLMSTFFE
jgi:hypothetical protein